MCLAPDMPSPPPPVPAVAPIQTPDPMDLPGDKKKRTGLSQLRIANKSDEGAGLTIASQAAAPK